MAESLLIGFHYGPKDDPVKHDSRVTREFGGVMRHIQESSGHQPVVTRGAGHLDFTTGYVDELWVPTIEDGRVRTTRDMGGAALERFGVIRDLGKKIRPTEAHPVPLLNGPDVIRINDSKLAMYQLLFEDMQGLTLPLADARAAEAASEQLKGDLFIVKPDNGAGGRGVRAVDKTELRTILDVIQPDKLHVVQEYVDMTRPFPAAIKGLDQEEQERLKSLENRKKELRVFVFYGANGMQVLPFARMLKQDDEKSDTWAILDPECTPEEVIGYCQTTFDRLSQQTGTPEIYGAEDFIWGSTASQPDPQWLAGEVNLWRPAVPRRKPEISNRHDQMLAEQLIRIAGNKKDVS